MAIKYILRFTGIILHVDVFLVDEGELDSAAIWQACFSGTFLGYLKSAKKGQAIGR